MGTRTEFTNMTDTMKIQSRCGYRYEDDSVDYATTKRIQCTEKAHNKVV